jgi:hypothetical protein
MLDGRLGVDGSENAGKERTRGFNEATTDGTSSGVVGIPVKEDKSSDDETTGVEAMLVESEVTGAAERSDDSRTKRFTDNTGVGTAFAVFDFSTAGERLDEETADNDATSNAIGSRVKLDSTGVD